MSIDTKGGHRTFAAVCTADKAAVRCARLNDRLATFGQLLKLGKDVSPIPKMNVVAA